MKHCPNPDCWGLAKFKIISEYEDTVEICADCQAPLVHGPAPAVPDPDLVAEPGWEPEYPDSAMPRPAEPDPDLKLVSVFTVRNESVLLIVESMLDEAGIPYLARGGQIQDLFGMGRLVAVNPVTEPVEFLVSETDQEAARVLLKDFKT